MNLEEKAEKYADESGYDLSLEGGEYGAVISLIKQAFLAGAAADKWIKCSERLPEQGQLVLGIVIGLVNNMVEPDKMFLDAHGRWQMREAIGKPVFPPTHWQPLPEPPKEQDEQAG